MERFNLENQYQLYLQKMGFREESMHAIQKVETRRAFMAGCGTMLLTMRDDVGALGEDEAVDALGNMIDQTIEFWKNEAN